MAVTPEQIYIDRTNKRLLARTDGRFEPITAQSLILASHNGQIPIEVFPIERKSGSGYDAYSASGYSSASYATSDLRITVGQCGECSIDSGTFKLTHSAVDTEEIDGATLSPDVIERALNSLASIRTAGFVQVGAIGSGNKFLVEAITPGVLGAITSAEVSLMPKSSLSIVEVDPGSSSLKARYVITIRPEPYADLTSWSNTAAASVAITERTAGSSSQYETQRIEITGPVQDGYITVVSGTTYANTIPVDTSAADVQDILNSLLGARRSHRRQASRGNLGRHMDHAR
jgi:hypothetical protein